MNGTKYKFDNDQGRLIDATFGFEDGQLIFYSWDGTKKHKRAQNPDYAEGLRLIIQRIADSKYSIKRIIVDSPTVQNIPLEERIIFSSPSMPVLVDEITARMKRVGQVPDAEGGALTRRLKFEFVENISSKQLIEVLRGIEVDNGGYLKNDVQKQATPEYIHRAVEKLKKNPKDHKFGSSKVYDVVLDDGMRLSPKAVFGVALNYALGIEVGWQHFTSNAVCRGALKKAGYKVVKKSEEISDETIPESETETMPESEPETMPESATETIPESETETMPESATETIPESAEDRAWVEGKPKRVTHLKKERQSGLANKKRRAFIEKNGRLFCERCEIDPIETYGKYGEACIEVHHITPLADIKKESKTRLEDLQCLCANCHRIVHEEIRESKRPDAL